MRHDRLNIAPKLVPTATRKPRAGVVDDCARPRTVSRDRRRRSVGACDCTERRQGQILLDQYQRFFNALPMTDDPARWAGALRHALHHLCPDVDRITLAIDVACRPELGDRPVGHVVLSDPNADGRASCPAGPAGSSPGDIVARRAAREPGFAGQFRTPVAFDYYSAAGEYVGSIILWNERRRPPVSELTMATMRAAQPLLAFLLVEGGLRARASATSPDCVGLLGSAFARFAVSSSRPEATR